MEKTIKKFGGIKIEKPKFHQDKRPISIKNIDIDKILVSNKVSFDKKGFKYFNGYKNTQKNNPLYIYLFQKWVHIEEAYEYVSFLMKDDKLLKKYYEMWGKVKNSLKKEFDSEPVYNQKYLRAKMQSYNGKMNTNFYSNKVPKEGSQYTCL